MRKLNYFLTVANYQNLNRAAEFLGVQPSTLTKSIKKQEDEMGAQLFRRHGKGMSLTPEGKVFYEFAMSVQRELEYVHLEFGSGTKQVIKVLFGMACPHRPFIEYFLEIQKIYPNVHFVIETKMFAPIGSRERSKYDMIIGGIPTEYLKEDHNIKDFFHIMNVQTKIFASIHHPLHQQKNITWADINQYPWIMFFEDYTLQNILIQKSKECNLPPPKFAIEVSSVAFTKEFIHSAENYLAALPYPSSDPTIKDIDYPELRYLDIGLLYNLRLRRFPFFNTFLNLLKQSQNF